MTAVRLGQLRVRQGDGEEARILFESALPASQAVVALGELDLESGDAQAAAEAAERVLRRGRHMSKLERFGALELLARARARAGDIAGASEVAAELEREAERLTTPHMRARSALVTAHVQLAAGAHDDARRAAEDAADLFSTCAAPYDAARARLVLADALTALDRPERAAAEARAAGEAMAALTERRKRQPAVGDAVDDARDRDPPAGRAGAFRQRDRRSPLPQSAHGPPLTWPTCARSCGCPRAPPRSRTRRAPACSEPGWPEPAIPRHGRIRRSGSGLCRAGSRRGRRSAPCPSRLTFLPGEP